MSANILVDSRFYFLIRVKAQVLASLRENNPIDWILADYDQSIKFSAQAKFGRHMNVELDFQILT